MDELSPQAEARDIELAATRPGCGPNSAEGGETPRPCVLSYYLVSYCVVQMRGERT